MNNIKWSVAKIGFKLIKPWIREQGEIDGDPAQVEEILNEVIRDAMRVEPCIEMHFDNTGADTPRGFDYTRIFIFENAPILVVDEGLFKDAAVRTLENEILGYRFDEDSWFGFDWQDAKTLELHFKEPYMARRLPL